MTTTSARAAEPMITSGRTHDEAKLRTTGLDCRSYEKVGGMGSGMGSSRSMTSSTSSVIGIRFPIIPQWHRAISKVYGAVAASVE